MRRLARRGALALALAVLVAACSGKEEAPASGCTRAAEPTSGPGDTRLYFPAAVGWTWTYDLSGTSGPGSSTTTLTGTQVVGGETASVFTTGSTAQLVVKRPWGAYVLSDGSVDPPLDALYPSLVLPFPVVAQNATRLVTCTNVATPDLDGDGKPDRIDLTADLTVHTGETAEVGAGTFVDVANVQTSAVITAHGSSLGSVALTLVGNEWYAPGVGRVSMRQELSGPGLYELATGALASYAPPAALAPAAPASLATAAAVVEAPRTFVEAAADLARALAGIRGMPRR